MKCFSQLVIIHKGGVKMRAIGTLETWGRDVAAWDLEALEGCLWAEMD
jgi:hypothetical protein